MGMDPVKTTEGGQKVPYRYPVIFAAVLVSAAWLLITPPGIIGKVNAIAYAVCHRIGTHSFYIGQQQMPLCARCTGMYLGAVLGIIFQSVTARRRAGFPGWKVGIFLGILFIAFAMDGTNSFLHFFPGMPSLYEPNNWLRLLTGTGMGLVIAAVLFPVVNQSIWSTYDPEPAIKNWRPVAIMVLLSLVVDGLVLSGKPIILYPLAFISVAGVVILLTMLYMVIWLTLTRLENHYQKFQQLLLPLTAGFTVGLLQIAVFDIVRFWLTGTWEGFHIG